MARVYDDPSTTENEDELFGDGSSSDSGSFMPIIIVLTVGFLIAMPIPIILALLVTFSVWALFRWQHVRASVITGFSAIGVILCIMLFSATFDLDSMPALLSAVTGKDAGSVMSRLFMVWRGTAGLTWLGIAIGLIAGSFCSWITRGRIHNNPYLVVTRGEKYYHWRYRRTPRQLLARERMIKAMKADAFKSKKGSFPMGIEEEPINPPDDPAYIKCDVPISRCDSEAFTHAIITGASGSGKAAEKSTIIPTLSGFKKIIDVKTGDILFDENGNRTKVLAKYHPNTPDHYEISFSDGTKIKVCGDHLWQINHVSQRKHTGRALISVYDDEQLNALQSALAITSSDETITSEQAKKEFGDWIIDNSVITYWNAIKNVKHSQESYYDRDAFISKLNRSKSDESNKYRDALMMIANDDKNLVDGRFLRRSQLMDACDGNGRYITALTRYIKGADRTTSQYAMYNRREYLAALIDDELRRRERIASIDNNGRRNNPRITVNMLESEVLDTRTMYEAMEHNTTGRALYSVNATGCVDYPEQDLPVSPYAFGAWLGDGSSYGGVICSVDDEVKDAVTNEGYELIGNKIVPAENGRNYALNNWRFKNLHHELLHDSGLKTYDDKPNRLIKDIPDVYIISSREQRIALLSGLLDTDGYISKSGRVEISMTDEQVVRKMRSIVCSLGWIPTNIRKRNNKYVNDGKTIECKPSYRFEFYPDVQLFHVARKAARLQARLDDIDNGLLSQQARNSQRYIESIVPIHDSNEDYYCLTVDSPSHLFLCSESYIPTHNTITMQNMIRHNMQDKQTLFIIDCKADPNFACKMASWSHELGLNFYHFAPTMGSEYRITQNPDGPAFYDPLAHGRAADHTDMLISTREWDAASAVYKSNAQSMLSTVFAIMDEMNRKDPRLADIDFNRGTMWTFYELIRNEGNLTSAIGTIPSQSNTRALADELETLIHANNRAREAQGVQNAMGEYKGFMRGLMTSDGKYMVYPKNDRNRKIIDVFKLASEPGNVVLFSISATKATDVGAMVGSMICTDLTNMTAMRAISGQTNPVSIYVDEFQSLPPTSVKSMLEKARSAKIGITLAFQSLEQVTASTGSDAMVNSLLDTCGNFIFHAGSNETTAQTMSQIIGKHWTNSYSIQRRNQQGMLEINFGNKRNANVMTTQVEKYIIEPSAFQHLSAPRKENGFKSEAIVIKKASSDAIDAGATGPVAHKVWMIPPDEIIADDYFDPNAPIMRFDDETPETGIDEFPDGKQPSFISAQENMFNDAPQEPIEQSTTGMNPMNTRRSRPTPQPQPVNDDAGLFNDNANADDELFTGVSSMMDLQNDAIERNERTPERSAQAQRRSIPKPGQEPQQHRRMIPKPGQKPGQEPASQDDDMFNDNPEPVRPVRGNNATSSQQQRPVHRLQNRSGAGRLQNRSLQRSNSPRMKEAPRRTMEPVQMEDKPVRRKPVAPRRKPVAPRKQN